MKLNYKRFKVNGGNEKNTMLMLIHGKYAIKFVKMSTKRQS